MPPYTLQDPPNPEIFRAYDIRGIVPDSLNEGVAYTLGRAFGSEALACGQPSMHLGCDGRLSSPSLQQATLAGLLDTGIQVVDLGKIPTPLLYYACATAEIASGIEITGSHNPKHYNGFKTVINGERLAEERIRRIQQRILERDFVNGQGEVKRQDIITPYIQHVQRLHTLPRPLKVVVDCGNGITGAVAPTLLRSLNAEVIPLFTEVDGNFPNHHPDPTRAENLQALIATVIREQADLGVAFDGDGDRLGVVTNRGEIIPADRLLMLFAQAVLRKRPGARIIYDVKCTKYLVDVIQAAGGEPIMCRTGHSFVKAKMVETAAALAGEMSGHIFFAEPWLGFDDGLYSACVLLDILAHSQHSAHDMFHALPTSVNTPEILIPIAEHLKFELVSRFAEDARFPDACRIAVDGLRVEFCDGWGLVRASNTSPNLILRFEADSAQALQRIQNNFITEIAQLSPAIADSLRDQVR